MNDLMIELNAVMNLFALVDQCQNTSHHSLDFSMNAMPKIDRMIKSNLHHSQSKELYNELHHIFLSTLETNGENKS